MSMVMFMYANEVGAKIAFDDGALLRPSTRQKMSWFIAYFVKQVSIIEQNTGKYIMFSALKNTAMDRGNTQLAMSI